MENNNKLIAEFLGFQQTNIGWYDSEEVLLRIERDNTFDDLKFDTDWNWLMKAVEKINDFNNVVSINENHVLIINNEKSKVIVDVVAGNMIEATYNAVVEFIKLHNEQ
jgi:hypothetical protein